MVTEDFRDNYWSLRDIDRALVSMALREDYFSGFSSPPETILLSWAESLVAFCFYRPGAAEVWYEIRRRIRNERRRPK